VDIGHTSAPDPINSGWLMVAKVPPSMIFRTDLEWYRTDLALVWGGCEDNPWKVS